MCGSSSVLSSSKSRLSDLKLFERHVSALMTNGEHNFRLGEFVSTLLDGRSYRLPLWENYRHSGEPKGEIAQAFAQVQRMLNILVRTEYALDLITCAELQLTIVDVHRPANGLIRRGSFKNGLEVLDGFVKPYIDEDLPLSRRKITVYPR